MDTKLLKSFAKTIIISEKAQISIANKLSKAIEQEPHRAIELRKTAVLLRVDKLISSAKIN